VKTLLCTFHINQPTKGYEEVFDILCRQFVRRLVMQEALKLAAPIRIGLERFSGIVPCLDLCREIVDNLVPFRRPGFLQTSPFIITTAC